MATVDGTTVPAHVPAELVRDFDYHNDPEFLADPFAAFDRLRGTRVFWSTSFGGYWVLTRAEDIREAFQHPELFSNHPVGIPAGEGWPRKLIPEELDPPEHGVYRHILALPFSPGAVVTMAEQVRSVCIGLIDPLVDAGGCEFLDAFARPYPTTIFTGILGIPVEESAKFLAWNYDLLHSYESERRAQAGANIAGYLTQHIEERSREPKEDLTSYLLAASVEGRPMTKEEVLDTCFLMFMAGLDTVTAALGFIFRHLAEHPELRRRLVAEPGLVPQAVEELLRFHAFVNPARTVTRDVTFAGVEMKQGDRVLVSTALASRDPEEFTQPTTVDIHRERNHHIAFGAGPHRCVGSHLARRELHVAVNEWLARIPDFRVGEGAEIRAHGGGVMGIDHLPLVWP